MNEAATQQAAVCRWLDKCEETRTINAPVMVAMLRLAVRSGALSVPTLRYIAKGLGATAVELGDARDERGTRSQQRVGRLCARWREEAVAMDEIADEEGDDECILALECRERSRTLRDCANALEREWAGTEPTEPSSATCGADAPQRADCRTAGSQQRVGSRTPEQEPSAARTTDAARSGVVGKDL